MGSFLAKIQILLNLFAGRAYKRLSRLKLCRSTSQSTNWSATFTEMIRFTSPFLSFLLPLTVCAETVSDVVGYARLEVSAGQSRAIGSPFGDNGETTPDFFAEGASDGDWLHVWPVSE